MHNTIFSLSMSKLKSLFLGHIRWLEIVLTSSESNQYSSAPKEISNLMYMTGYFCTFSICILLNYGTDIFIPN